VPPRTSAITGITERFVLRWGRNPLNLNCCRARSELSIGTDLGRTMRTIDGGATWVALFAQGRFRGVDNCWPGRDHNLRRHFDPFDSKRMFITYTDIGTVSQRGWRCVIGRSSKTGVRGSGMNTTYWLVFRPESIRAVCGAVNSIYPRLAASEK